MGRWVILLLGQHYLFYGTMGYTVDRTTLPVLWNSGLHCIDKATRPGLSDSVLHCRQDNITWFMGRWFTLYIGHYLVYGTWFTLYIGHYLVYGTVVYIVYRTLPGLSDGGLHCI